MVRSAARGELNSGKRRKKNKIENVRPPVLGAKKKQPKKVFTSFAIQRRGLM